MNRSALNRAGLCACAVLAGCGVAIGGSRHGEPPATLFPDINLSARPCAIQTTGLLIANELPPGLASTGLPTSQLGPHALLGDASDGSVGSADQDFQANGPGAPPSQIAQLAEEVTDYGTVATAERWMLGQKASNQPNDIPMHGNGVERTPAVPAMGDDVLLYQIDEGAPYNSIPFTGPFVGHVYTDIQVRAGDVIYALSIDSGPDANPATLAVSLVQQLIAKEKTVCG